MRYLEERAGIEVATRVEAEIYGAFETLAQNPRLGHKRSDLTSHPVLFFTVYSYMIVYRLVRQLKSYAFSTASGI